VLVDPLLVGPVVGAEPADRAEYPDDAEPADGHPARGALEALPGPGREALEALVGRGALELDRAAPVRWWVMVCSAAFSVS
jgi:hypothetical protein